MKKIFILLFVLTLTLTGCKSDVEVNESLIRSQENEINKLAEELSNLEAKKNKLLNNIQDIETENGLEKYIITLNLSQSHFTLDVGKHIKNAMNDIDIQIPVDKEFYDNVQEGDILDDTFRMGSLLMEGSFGKWKVKVAKKEIM